MNAEHWLIPTQGLSHLPWFLLATLLMMYVSLRAIFLEGGLYYWITRFSFPQNHRVFRLAYMPGQISSEIKSNLISILIDGVFFATLIKWSPLPPQDGWFFTTFIVSFFWFEIWFYISHRTLHSPRLFFIHRQHHVAKVTSPFSALSFSIVERLILLTGGIGFMFLLSFFFPLSALGLALYLVFNYLLNLIAHSNVEFFPSRWLNSPWGRFFNAPTYHALHHARNKGHFGLFTPFLDQIFQTRFQDYPEVQKMAFQQNGLTSLGAKCPSHSPVALITGASSGIGEALAYEYGKAGYRVVLCARRTEQLQKISQLLQQKGISNLFFTCDVRQRSDIEKAVQSTLEKFGRIDVVVANAGTGVYGTVESLEPADFSRQFETNIYGVLHTVQASLPALKQTQGRLALVGSAYSYFSFPATAPYTMSKFAVRSLAESLYYELKPEKVSVTLICPGVIGTEFRKINNWGHSREGATEMMPALFTMPASTAARKIKRAIDCRKAEAVITLHGKFGVFVRNHFPGFYRQVISWMSTYILNFVDRKILEKSF